MNEPLVDVIVAVHTDTRPVERAVRSVLHGTKAPVRVTVVAHNIETERIEMRLAELVVDPRVRLLQLSDGIHSPAGPMNFGIANSESRFVALLGSDDEFAPGAIDSWLALQQQTGADAVLASIRLASGGIDPYPPVRLGRRTTALDPLKDRLAYRSAPLGLISHDRFAELRLTTGVLSGEDLAYSLTVWFTGANLAYDLDGPEYVINADAGDRVTFVPRPALQDFSFLDAIEALPWFMGAKKQVREAIVVKLIRMHFFDAVRSRLADEDRFGAERDDLRSLLLRLIDWAPSSISRLSIADRRVCEEMVNGAAEAVRLHTLLEARGRYTSPVALLTRNPLHWLHRQAPLRTLLAGLLITLRK